MGNIKITGRGLKLYLQTLKGVREKVKNTNYDSNC